LPTGEFELVVMLSVLLPDPLEIEAGLSVALAPGGSPLALKLTVAEKPPDEVTVTL
jgi:hypothetical protein